MLRNAAWNSSTSVKADFVLRGIAVRYKAAGMSPNLGYWIVLRLRNTRISSQTANLHRPGVLAIHFRQK